MIVYMGLVKEFYIDNLTEEEIEEIAEENYRVFEKTYEEYEEYFLSLNHGYESR
jgi:Pyruvate/2-oxoacid:ferredoxin oxidoreductase gamma subunit